MNTLNSPTIILWLRQAARAFEEKKDYLTELDSLIGDADHGANMARGFAAVVAKVEGMGELDLGSIFKTTAMTLLSTVGGASGPLYGSFFLQMAPQANGKKELTEKDFGGCLEAGIKAIAARGKAMRGDKTMLDALFPALDAYQSAVQDGLATALHQAALEARAGAEATIPWIAKKGRASYLGERSAGHKDPGAESSAMLLEILERVVVS